MADDEQIVLLNDNWEPIGTAPKLASHNSNTPLHLAFSSYIFNDEGRVLVTRRALSKKTWPGIWTNSCCGHPAPGEVLEDALMRRVQTELGMEVDGVQVKIPNFRYRVELNGVVENECCPVYIAHALGNPQPNPSEVMDYIWLSWEELIAAIKTTPNMYSEWCRLQIPLLLPLLD